jgi:signal transduction histidine kinase/ActR/RegA family two-component response regulator
MKKNYIISFNRERWLSLAVQRVALAAVLCTLLAIVLNFFDHSKSLTWIIAGASIVVCTGAFFLMKTENLIVRLVAFGMSMGMANYVGTLLPFENGLVFIYPLLLCTFILTQNKRSELITLSTAGFISFACYMSISIDNTIVTASEPSNLLQFFTTSICLGTISLQLFLYARKWGVERDRMKIKYDKLNSFVKFVNESPLPLMRIDEAGDVLLMNGSARNLLTNSDNRLNYPPGLSQTIMAGFSTGEPQELSTSIKDRRLKISLIPGKNRAYVNLYCEDTTDIEKASEKVRELNSAMDLAADGVCILDRTGVLEYANKSFCAILGHKHPVLVVGQPWKKFCHKSWFSTFQDEVLPALSLEHVWRGEALSLKEDGCQLQTDITFTRLPGSRTVCYLKDNTNIKEYQSELIKSKKDAEAATKAKSEFLATMSHEIRTPMNGVLGMANLLANSELNETQFEYVDTIQHSGENLLSIINEILDFSKIEAQKMEMSYAKMSLRKLVKNALSLTTHRASIRNNTIITDIKQDVPTFILGDYGRITQIVNNLLSNAIKFTKSGTVEVNITTERTENFREHKIRIAVKDSGIGIALDKQADLFTPFTQADSSTSRQYGGTGLGLTICKRLAELMNGDVSVQSVPGEGSTFNFEFTSLEIPGTEDEQKTIESTSTIDTTLADNYPLSILIAEDNFINQKLAQQLFERMGYTVALAQNGLEAVEAAQKTMFDLVFMDIHMPEMDGLEATRVIRKDESCGEPYIVALTANVINESETQCKEAGMDHFIQKPFKLSEIHEVVELVGKRCLARNADQL